MHGGHIRFGAAVLLAAALAVAPGIAAAHAIIRSAVPAVGAVVRGSTVEVLLRFNSRLDRERSRLTLMGADGASTVVALKDTDSLDTLAATIAGVAPGAYRLHWQVLAVDGHITRGDIPFSVAP